MELYIHIPFCVKKCDYCDFLSAPWPTEVRRAYTKALCAEIAFFGAVLESPLLETIYIGGGTPTWLEAVLLDEIMQTVYKHFSIAEDAEISMECNPGTVSLSDFSSYRRWGLNRLSIGLQSANDEELRLLGRAYTYSRFLSTYENARRSGFYNINIDIMTGLPRQTDEKLLRTLEKVISLRPEHVSAYALTIEEGTPFFDRYQLDEKRRQAGMPTAELPDDDASYFLSKMTENVLAEHGYERYEISNFAKGGLVCRHNIGYWKREPYLGVGLGAASLLGNVRYANERDMESYIAHAMELQTQQEAVSPMWERADELSRKNEIEEFMYLGLRMTEGIWRQDFEQCFGQPIESFYKAKLDTLKEQGLLRMEGGRIFLTELGMDISNRVLAEFLF